MPSIVTVNVSVQQAPTPSKLQQTGAMLSTGATTTAPGTLTLLTAMSDLTPWLTGSATISNLTWSGSVVSVTTTTPHGLTIGENVEVTIAGAAPAGYNGVFLATITGSNAFTYPLVVNPGSMTLPGVWTVEDVGELLAMATTFFAQGANQSVYVLELGALDVTNSVAYLTTWIQNNPLTIYSYLVPRTWDVNAAFLTLLQSYESPTGKTYFFVTTTVGTYTTYTALQKDVIALIEAPTVQLYGEFSIAAAFYHSLNYNPNNTNKVAPFAFSYLYGVTPYPTIGNGALLTTLKNANINVVGTGAEGGISNTILLWGTTLDGRDFTYWYSIDYAQIQADLVLSNEVINGSNNPVNPLYYDQPGINRLQARLQGLMSNMITFGLANGTVTLTELDGPALSNNIDTNVYVNQAVINAVPFVTYSLANPGDYKIGRYAGLTIIYVPTRGFISIVLNIVASDFIAV